MRDRFEWRGLGWVPASALRLRDDYARFDAEVRFGMATPSRLRQPGLRMRRHPARRETPGRVPAVRHGLHAGNPDGLLHGLLRGRLRGALDLRPVPRSAPGGWPRDGARPSRLDIRSGRVDLSHGAGGRAMAQLIADIFDADLRQRYLAQGNDQAAFDVPGGRMVMTTDGYVVSPLFFPGGDIGSLAVHGTINDLAMAGARPLASDRQLHPRGRLSARRPRAHRRQHGRAGREAGVPVVAGDTKVVERGKADGVFISTAGIGLVPPGIVAFRRPGRPGDACCCPGRSATMAWRSCRAAKTCRSTRRSFDSAALHGLVAAMVARPARACG